MRLHSQRGKFGITPKMRLGCSVDRGAPRSEGPPCWGCGAASTGLAGESGPGGFCALDCGAGAAFGCWACDCCPGSFGRLLSEKKRCKQKKCSGRNETHRFPPRSWIGSIEIVTFSEFGYREGGF